MDDEQLYPTGGKWAGEDDSSDAEREEAEWKAGYGKDASQGWEAEAGYKTFTRGQKVRTPTGKIRTVHSQRGAQVFVEEESNGWYHPSKLWPVKKSAEDDALEEAVRQGLRDAVAKHGSGDQSPHGNWARSKELGMVTIPEDDDSAARPEDEERDEELRRSRRMHTTRDGVVIEDQPKVQHIKNSEMFASADGRVQLNYGEWKWTSAGQSRGVAKPPKLHERGHWGVWPRGADRSDISNVIWGKQQDPGRVHQLPRPRRI